MNQSGSGAKVAAVSTPLDTNHAVDRSPPAPDSARTKATAATAPPSAAPRGKATRTYTDAQLERRRAWGREWGQVGKAWKLAHNNEGN